jgi:hypothetical protein
MNATLVQPPCRKFFFPAALKNPLPKKWRIPPRGGANPPEIGGGFRLTVFLSNMGSYCRPARIRLAYQPQPERSADRMEEPECGGADCIDSGHQCPRSGADGRSEGAET